MTLEHGAAPADSATRTDPTHLFADHYMPVLRLCMHHLRDESDAEDATQEVFRRALQRHAELRGDPLPWLITVAKNVCRDELRRRRNGLRAIERSAATEHGCALMAVEDNPERVVVGEHFVRDLLGRLTPAERRVLEARVYHGASGADAAQTLGVSGSTTRVLLARARAKLRVYLESGQAAFGAVPLAGLRLAHGLRRHLLLRPGHAEAGAGLLVPAALLVTVMMSPATGVAPALAGGAGAVAVAGGGAGAVHDVRVGALRPGTTTTILVQRPDAPPASHASSPYHALPGPSLLPPLTPEYDRVVVSDIEPSPNYSQDHTVLMLGSNTGCSPPPCTQLFRSTDGGATWTFLGAPAPTGNTLILPPSSFDQGTFYVASAVGLQMTTDGGKTFLNAMPSPPGYAVAAPAWTGLGVVLSNEALWQLDGAAPKLLAAFGTNQKAVSPPLFLPTQGGVEELQAVSDAVNVNSRTLVLRCTDGVCGDPVTLPFWSTTMALVASPNYAADKTIFAVGLGHFLSVSHDGGHTFGAAVPLVASQLIAVPHAAGRRLVAIVTSNNLQTLQMSDDDGTTWQAASIDPSLRLMDWAWQLRALASGRLIASMIRSDQTTYTNFACSTDGSVWTSCSSTTTS